MNDNKNLLEIVSALIDQSFSSSPKEKKEGFEKMKKLIELNEDNFWNEKIGNCKMKTKNTKPQNKTLKNK